MAKIQNLFFDIEPTMKIKRGNTLAKLTASHNRREYVRRLGMNQLDCENESCPATQILQMQENQKCAEKKHLEQFCKVLRVSGFNSSSFDVNFIKSQCFLVFASERDIEPTVVNEPNEIILFKFDDNQALGIMNFLGGATSLDSFLNA